MKTALKMKTTLIMDIPQKDTPTNVEDLSEVKRTSKWRHILCLHYDRCRTSCFEYWIIDYDMIQIYLFQKFTTSSHWAVILLILALISSKLIVLALVSTSKICIRINSSRRLSTWWTMKDYKIRCKILGLPKTEILGTFIYS